jgi:hypothetical protein
VRHTRRRYENTSGNKVDDYIEKMFSIGFDQEHIGVRAPFQRRLNARSNLLTCGGTATHDTHTQLISAVRMYAGASVRLGDLFENKSFIKMARSTITRGLKVPCGPHSPLCDTHRSLLNTTAHNGTQRHTTQQGVDNIYTEHSPMIRNILQQVRFYAFLSYEWFLRWRATSDAFPPGLGAPRFSRGVCPKTTTPSSAARPAGRGRRRSSSS